MDWQTIVFAMACLHDNEWLMGLDYALRTSNHLLELAKLAQSRKATDQRDVIFSMLGLLEEVPAVLKADYSKTMLEVYSSVVQCFVYHPPRTLSFLHSAGTSSYPDGADFIDWPSWVPQWNLRTTHSVDEEDERFRADAEIGIDANPPQLSDKSKVLSVTGVKVDIISHVAKLDRCTQLNRGGKYNTREGLVQRIHEAWELSVAHGVPPETSSMNTEPFIIPMLDAFV